MKQPKLIARASTNPDRPRLTKLLPTAILFEPNQPTEFSAFETRFSTPEAARVVGVEVATMLNWRRKFGLFGWSPGGKGETIYWSIVDLIMMRLAIVMMDHGIKPQDAAWFIGARETPKEVALGAVIGIGAIITTPKAESLVAFHPGGTVRHPNDKVSFYRLGAREKIGDVFQHIKKTALRFEITLIDLRDIIRHVEDALQIEIFAKDAA
jgi:hypothetical protein